MLLNISEHTTSWRHKERDEVYALYSINCCGRKGSPQPGQVKDWVRDGKRSVQGS